MDQETLDTTAVEFRSEVWMSRSTFSMLTGHSVEGIENEANKDCAEAQFSLGVMYGDGIGIEKDETEAVKWYRKAAEQGLSEAQTNLAVMYANGRGVEKDEAEAFKWFKCAAAQKCARAHNII